VHGREEIGPGLLAKILRDCDLSRDELRDLLRSSIQLLVHQLERFGGERSHVGDAVARASAQGYGPYTLVAARAHRSHHDLRPLVGRAIGLWPTDRKQDADRGANVEAWLRSAGTSVARIWA